MYRSPDGLRLYEGLSFHERKGNQSTYPYLVAYHSCNKQRKGVQNAPLFTLTCRESAETEIQVSHPDTSETKTRQKP